MAENQILALQNAEKQIRLLMARRALYAYGQRLLTLQLLLTVGIPVVGTIAGLYFASAKPYVAIASLTIAILDATFFDRLLKTVRVSAAKIAEKFDCTVLGIPWNDFTVGRGVSSEEIQEAADQYTRIEHRETPLPNWYPVAVGQVPLHQARIICQRTNLWYDGKLRRRYGAIVLGSGAMLVLLLFFAAIYTGLDLTSFVLSVLAPASPIVVWAIREHCRQADTASALDRLKTLSEALWDRVKRGECDAETCAAQSREFQNAIYDRRASSPMIFDWLYKRLRPKLEAQMNRGAEDMVLEIIKAD